MFGVQSKIKRERERTQEKESPSLLALELVWSRMSVATRLCQADQAGAEILALVVTVRGAKHAKHLHEVTHRTT